MTAINKIKRFLSGEQSIAPLVIFRILFGALMLCSIVRFIYKGWVYNLYIAPKMHFPYYGLEWVKAMPGVGMYLVFAFMIIACIGILLGAMYRLSSVLFFLLFTYVELIDKTNYLNHYYFISLISFLMIFMPSAKAFSFDNLIFKRKGIKKTSRIFLFTLQLQMFVVYFFAGIAKINPHWLLDAQPLRIWLPAFSHFPLIGPYMELDTTAYVFSWFGCVYDLLIGFFLFNRRTVYVAYIFVIVFHTATALFFNIGMFPYIMMIITLVFFPETFHEKILYRLRRIFTKFPVENTVLPKAINKSLFALFIAYFVIQFLLPFRYLLYNGKLFWTEQGYRFSWRVMLMEKAGAAFFRLHDLASGRQIEINNHHHLTFMQEKMMTTQPDMMVDYAQHLRNYYTKKGFSNFEIRASAYVTLNGSGSRSFIDSSIDLSSQSNSFLKNKTWIKCYE